MSAMRSAIQSAHQSESKYFSETTATVRGQLLTKWYDLVMSNIEDLSVLVCLENGKVLSEARDEVSYAATFISWFAAEAPRAYGDVIPSKTPNTMVLTLKEAVGDRQVASELAVNPLIQKISFTGSTRVGKTLAKLAAGTVKQLSLELGGNAPFVVFEDADLDLAVEGAISSKFRCAGQTCVCTNRIYVQKNVAEEFSRKLIKQVEKLRCGSGLLEGSTQGLLINRAAVQKVQSQIEDAVSKGAQIRTGAVMPTELDQGFFFQPTVLSAVTADVAVAKDETFGPLATIFVFEAEDEVVEMANSTEFGLAGYLYSRDIDQVLRVSQKMQVGMCGMNTGKVSAPESPFGGIKQSGYGTEGSKYSVTEYQTLKTVTIGNINHCDTYFQMSKLTILAVEAHHNSIVFIFQAITSYQTHMCSSRRRTNFNK
ncbi:Succinate-semialdehyde dehydrogenase, mitochondrial [Aspergillus nanangensis]|uniref:Succinate-semialdehyde dehydrogenase, mitochondrial n=1 Tax=Aspergillus nanangensis TaxID=2582783 RepID=A0AAD4CAY5_ASPNN|nr:Succinate-semialdehyde dehydrogenase, mitochondrial [Aspergillus nanangensis]